MDKLLIHAAVNSSSAEQISRHIADIFKCIFLDEKGHFLPKFHWSLFIAKGPTDNDLPMISIMAWYRIGDKPLSEPMLTRVTDAFMRH